MLGLDQETAHCVRNDDLLLLVEGGESEAPLHLLRYPGSRHREEARRTISVCNIITLKRIIKS